jgi:hypothetical protein
MAAISSPLGVCSLCRDGIAFAFLNACESMLQSREDFLNAQLKCYICTWILQILTLEVLNTLPKSFKILFSFYSDNEGTRLNVFTKESGLMFDLTFSVNSNAGKACDWTFRS